MSLASESDQIISFEISKFINAGKNSQHATTNFRENRHNNEEHIPANQSLSGNRQSLLESKLHTNTRGET